ncbi:serine hydrolase [Spirosoma sp. BT702]|uniref:Serine hydrolase n=1 Tax=Spirosoma profusum TaxID=2771354 RepID=A0A927AMM1_9BACT|nr:serine hydrolase domain-containing protein [Spirosoma profusum]MBD2700094.1 serine hydrolase [Spirosoma profusum]
MNVKKLLLSIVVLFMADHLSAQNRIDELERLVSFCQQNDMFNGNLLVAENGQIIYHKSIGFADFETQRPLTSHTPFCVGSIAKQFTAMGIMILEQRGQLQYSDTVGALFPQLPPYLHGITIKNLLQHTSGLKRTHYQEHDGLVNEEVYQNLRNSVGDQLLFAPGTNLSYSNTAYILLALLIERVSGKTYEAFLQENVWHPLGMTQTFVMSKAHQGRADIAVGYDGFGHKADFNVLTYGTNGVYSTTQDLFKWSQSMSTDQLIPLSSKKVAYQAAQSPSGKVLDLKMRESTFSYGFGQYIYRDQFEGILGHSGAYGGFYNIHMRDMKHNRDVVVLTNNGRLLPIFDLGTSIHNILRGEAYRLPKTSIDLVIRKNYYHNIEKGIAYYHRLKKETPDQYTFSDQWELNRLGYALMADKRLADAINVFKLLVAEFPHSPNPYDSLGEAYYSNGQYELSLTSYQRALAINEHYDDADHAKAMIKKNQAKLAATKPNKGSKVER